MNSASKSESIVVRAACPHDCPDTCALLVTVKDGVATSVRGDPDHPTTAGVLCAKVSCYTERTYHKDRLLHPMKRLGKKGEGKFERISWDDALNTIAARLGEIAGCNPQAILPYSFAGTKGLVQGESMSMRFFNRIGASQLGRTICSTAGGAGYRYTLGTRMGADTEHVQEARLIIIWGGNPLASNLHFWTRVQEAKRRGAKLIAIDPYRSLSADKCHQHIAVMPGTDAALALGMMHVLINDNLLDSSYIASHTLGFEQLKQRVRGGGMAVRNIACLPALVGAWRYAGGGLQLSTSDSFPKNGDFLQRPDLLWRHGQVPRTINMSTIGDDLMRASSADFGPQIEALVVYNANPVAVAPDSGRVVQAFAREDLFTVVLEHFQTDTADYADVLLPATTQLEHVDVHATFGHVYMMANNAAVAPLGEARSNTEIFRQLAARMGFTEDCFRESDDAIAAQAFDRRHSGAADFDWERLKEKGWQRLNMPAAPFADGGFGTPSGKCEFYSAQMLSDGLDPLPTFIAPYESVASNAALAERYPLAMISPAARNFLNSSFVNVQSLRDTEGEPMLDIHPDDAAVRGIVDGAGVRIFNDRGSMQAKARVTPKARIGLVVGLSIWWKKFSGDGKNANELTSQGLTDMGGGPIFYDVLVQVEACEQGV